MPLSPCDSCDLCVCVCVCVCALSPCDSGDLSLSLSVGCIAFDATVAVRQWQSLSLSLSLSVSVSVSVIHTYPRLDTARAIPRMRALPLGSIATTRHEPRHSHKSVPKGLYSIKTLKRGLFRILDAYSGDAKPVSGFTLLRNRCVGRGQCT
jgi:hypothetical protein